MSDWTPDDEPWSPEPGPESHGDDEEAAGQPTEIRVIAPVPLPIRLEATERDDISPGEKAFATYLVGDEAPSRPIAVNSLPAEVVVALLDSPLFDEPRLIAATLHEEQGGLRGVLEVLLPTSAVQQWVSSLEEEDDDEPWRASVPEVPPFEVSAEGEARDDEPAVEVVPFPLGVVLRFPEDRRYPGDLLHEAADLLMSILGGLGTDAKQKKIDRLLDDL